MDLSSVAELQVLLEGVALPAERPELVEYAVRQHATPSQIGMLRGLPARRYETLDEVGEELVRVQPSEEREVPHRPEEESGDPPGGEAYTEKDPESGAVRI